MPVASRAHRIERLSANNGAGLLIGTPPPTAKLVDFSEPTDIQRTPITAVVPKSQYNERTLQRYLDDELSNAIAERSGLMMDFSRFEELYRAKLGGQKDFPFRNASNLTIPLIKEFVDTQKAALSQTVLIPGPAWLMRNFADEWSDFKGLIELFMDLVAARELKYADKVETWIQESLKMGTGIMELSHEIVEKSQYIFDDNSMRAKKITNVVKSGPALWNVPIRDFYIPFTEVDIQESPWVAKKFRLNAIQMKQRAANQVFDPRVVKKILTPQPTEGEKHQGGLDIGDGEPQTEGLDTIQELENTEPTRIYQYDIAEFWLSWNLDDGDDLETELQVYYHKQSQQILSVRYNPYRHGKRPFVKLCPLPTEHRFYGESYAERLEGAQLELSTIHNQRRDNATIANMRMFWSRRGANAMKPGDPVFAGRVVMVNDPSDIGAVQLGDVYPSTVQEEQASRTWAERSIGITDANSRGGFPVTRTTFGAQASLLQEQAKRLDNTIRNIREGLGEIGNMTFQLFFQFGAGDKPEAWLGKRGRILNGIFSLPFEAVAKGIGLEAAAPTSQLNREAQRQNSLALFNLMTQLYTQLIQMLQGITGDPVVMASVLGSLVSSAKQFMMETLQQFEVTNPDEVLSGLTFLEQVLPSPEDLGGLNRAQADETQALLLDRLDELRDSLNRAVGLKEIPASTFTAPQVTRSEQRVVVERGTRETTGEITGTSRRRR